MTSSSSLSIGALSSTAGGAAGTSVTPFELMVSPLEPVAWFDAWLNYPPIKVFVPLLILMAIAPFIWRFFRESWRALDGESAGGGGELDYRHAVCLLLTAVVLTMQEYYGGRDFYERHLRSTLLSLDSWGLSFLRAQKYDELYSYAWWVLARVIGYIVMPVLAWKLLFPRERVLEMGLRTQGFFSHLWIYGLCLAVVIPLTFVMSRQSDFGSYYPFYRLSSRSWFDFLLWEAVYCLQFFALEFFFRGWMLHALRRRMGFAAIFVMTMPYCMIHYGKPYLEAQGAIVAGVVLGSLAMRTRSIYAGFLVHITIAIGMDTLSLYKRSALPTTFWAGD